MDNDFILNLLALLDMKKSKGQINANIKELEQSIRKIKLTATFAKGNTKSELNQVIRQLESQLKQIKVQAKIDSRQLNREINAALRNVSASEIQLNINSTGERLNAQVRRAVSQAREFVNRNPISVNIDLKREKLLNQLVAFTNKHTKINESSYWLGEAERIRGVIEAVSNRNELRDATDQFQVFTTGVRATGYAAASTTDRIKGMLGNIVKAGNYFGLTFVAVNKFRQSLNTLKANDTILTEISKTSEMTKQQLKELGDEAFNVASKYGQVSGNYLTAVQEMARSGYEMMSKELGELSLLTQSAGDMSAEMANNYLLATDAAYKYGGSVEKLNAALDGANYISNKNSASLTDIADATRVSASFAANAGIAIDELTAAEATMIATTKRSGSEMGRAFRSIILNLQQVSGEFDGEEINEEQLKKVEERCHSLGVELEYMKDGVATLRNPMEVLKELAEVYNSLPDNSADKQGLISDLGGKYHSNALSALLSRWDMYKKMLGEFSQGTGSALEEANKTADSWEGRVAQLQNTWDSFVNSLTSKGAIKGGISFLNGTIQGFEKLTDTLGAIPVLLTTINGSMSALNKNYGITQIFNKDTRKIDLQGNFMGINITDYKKQINHYREASVAIRKWNEELITGTANVDIFDNATVQNAKHLKAYLQTTSTQAPASLAGYRAYLNAAGVSTDALRLKTVLMTSALSFGLTFAIQAAVVGISKLINMEREAVQSAQDAANAYSENSDSINDYISRYKDLQEALAAAKGNEQETYNVKRQLLELQTEINEKFGEEYGYLNLVTDAYKDKTSAIQAYNKEAANTLLNENMKGIRKAEEQMTKLRNYALSYGEISGSTEKGEALREVAERYSDQGLFLNEMDNGQFSIHLKADAQSAYDTINAFEGDLRDKAKEIGDESLFDDVLSLSSDSLNDTKEVIDEYGDIYRKSLAAEIATDDGKSVKYNEALEAVEAFNEAVLSSEDIYNDKNVEEARQSLQGIKEELSGEEWEKYGALIEDVFDQADTRLLDFNEQLGNDDSLKKLAEGLKGLDDIDLRAFDEAVGTNNSFDRLKESAESYGLSIDDLIDTLVRLGYVQTQASEGAEDVALSFKDKFQNLWDSEPFSDARKDLAKLAKESRITEKDIQSLASENSELASLLNESGMSAQFAATCFNKMSNGADGFSSITDDALALDKALHGMDESLQNVAASKSTYDKAMEQDDYNAEFEDYQEAYKNAMQMFEDGDYGRHFRSTMEYFLGEDSYTMSIDELYSAMSNLKGVFGENATNGLEFLDKLYAKKDILDGMGSSLRKLSDGSYDFDLKPEEFEKIGEALGMTAEEVAACTNALGMFGNFHSYDLDEVEKTLNGISIAAKDGGKSILSMQGVEKILADIGYNGYEVYHIMQDIQGMDSIQMLDFGADDAESIQAVINKLKELNMVEVNGDSINVSGLIESLHGSLGMAADDINAFLENINGKFQFTDAEGSLATLEQAKTMALQAEDEGAKEGVDRLGESARATDEDISRLHEDMERMNALNMQGLVTQFGNVGAKVDELGNKVRTVAGQMEGLNSGTATIPMLAGSKGQNASPGGKGQKPGKGQAHSKGTVGNAYAKGYDGLPKDERGALRSEYGQRELTVYPNGTYEVTDTPTMGDLPKGTVIFNESQTERILNAGIHGAVGNAYAGGTAGGTNPATGRPYRKSGGSSASNNESKKAAEEKTKEEIEQFEEVFDWIERRIEKFQRLFDKWVKQAETAVTSGFITKYYKKAANAIKKELSTYGKAYNRYMKEANAVGLDERYAKKVRNGTIDIETIRAEGSKEDVAKYEELADKIQKYQEYYNKAIESTTSFVETAEELYSLPLEKAAAKIEKFKDAIDLLDKRLDNAIGAKKKNKLIDRQTKEEKKTLEASKLARKESRKGLNAARKALTKKSTLRGPDVSKEDRKNIRNATKSGKEVSLSLFKEGSKAYNAAVKYNEALKANKKATYECSAAQQDYNSWLVEASKLKFDNIADGYEKKVQMIGYEMDALDRRISEIEAAGKNVDRLYYESQKKVNGRTLAQYQAEKAALEESLKGIKQGTDEWHDAYDQIQQVESAISDCVKETYGLNNAINQLHFDLFDEVSESIGRIVTEQEFLRGLFAHEKSVDGETGGFTEAGVAKLGSLSASYYAARNNADRDEALLKELQDVKERGRQANGHYVLGDWEFNSLEDLQEKIDETYTKWQGDIKDTYGLESEMSDLMKERYQAELDMVKELIDAKKEALDAEKDLHDYQRSISEKTKSISTIQKQIAAYSGDTSEEGMARLQKLQKELDDAKDGLKEAEYDRYVSDQKDMLDGLYKEYEDRTLEKTEDFMGLVQEGLGISNDNTALIAGYLEAIAKQNGYRIETTGVPGTSGDIKKDVDGAISDKASVKEAQSGTSSMPTGRTQPAAHEWGQPDGGQLMQAGGGVHKLHSAESDREAASDYIKKNARKAKKKKKEYADVNQRIFENKAKAYDGTGKVLPSDGLKGLAKKIGVEYDGAKKSDSLYKKLKSIKLPGFKKGGIARLIKENGEDGLTLARNGEGFIAPEHMGPIQELVESVPKINELVGMEADEAKKPITVNGVELIPVKTDLMRAFEALTPERRMEMFGIAPPPIAPSPSSGMPAPNQSITSNVNNVVNIDNITLPSVKDADEFCDYMFRKSQKSNNYKGFVKDLIGGAMKGHREPVFRPHL